MGLFRHLFKLAGTSERAMMVVGLLCTFVASFAIPLNASVLGYAVNVFIISDEREVEVLSENMIHIGLGVATTLLVTSYAGVTLWSWSGARIGAEVRKRYFRVLMSQSMGWFEVNNIHELVHRFETDIPTFVNGIGDRVPLSLQWLSAFILSYGVAFVASWKLTLAIILFNPIVLVVSAFIMKKVQSMSIIEYQTYVASGVEAEAGLMRLATIQAFNAYKWESSRYAGYLQQPSRLEIAKVMMLGFAIFFPWMVNIMAFCVAFGYGNYLVDNEDLKPGNIFPVFFGVLFASASMQQGFVNLDAITSAWTSAKPIMEVLDLQSPIDYFSDEGKTTAEGLKGMIAFRGVFFRYPNKINAKVLNSMDMRVQPGERVAIVGNKSSGISAIPKLILRLYDPNKGQILIDGVDIREYNLKWLRHQVAMVTKGAVLFSVSISDNIRHGRTDITMEQIEQAAKEANIHDYILSLPHGYDTIVSDEIIENFRPMQIAQRKRSSLHSTRSDSGHDGSLSKRNGVTGEWNRRNSNKPGEGAARPEGKRSISGYSSAMEEKRPISILNKGSAKPLKRVFVVANESDLRQGSRANRHSIVSQGGKKVPGNVRKSILWTDYDEHLKGANTRHDPQSSMRKADETENSCESIVALSSTKSTFVSTLVSWKGDKQLWKTGFLKDDMIALTVAVRTQLVIARALVSRPVILLMEDVLPLLDPKTKRVLVESLAARKQTLVFVTNRPSHVYYAERIIVVAHGRKVGEGTLAELLDRRRGPNAFSKLATSEETRAISRAAAGNRHWKKYSHSLTTFARLVDLVLEGVKKTEEEEDRGHLVRRQLQTTILKDISEANEQPDPIARLMRLQFAEALYISVGLIVSALLGLAPIGHAFVVATIVAVWHDKHHKKIAHYIGIVQIETWIYILVGSCFIVALLRLLLHYCFSVASTQLTTRVRTLMFEALLRQDLSFFDDPKQNPSILAHSLTHDPVLLQGVLGVQTGALLESAITVITGFSLAFTWEWKMTLLITAFAPLTVLGSVLQGKVQIWAEQSHSQSMAEANEVFMEAVENMPTLITLNMKDMYMKRLDTILDHDQRQAVRYAHLYGLGHGLFSLVILMNIAIVIFASYFIRENTAEFVNLFMSFCLLVFGTAEVDFSGTKRILVKYAQAKKAALKIFQLLDRQPVVGAMSAEGIILKPFQGLVEFKDVEFHQPDDPHIRLQKPFNGVVEFEDVKPFQGLVEFEDVMFYHPSDASLRVLNKLSLVLRPKQTLALVGPSGCGKSTIFRILQRFCDIDSGSVTIDGVDLHLLDLWWWRSQLGVVQEDPDFSTGTVKENITYGDPRQYIDLRKVIEVAKKADLHKSIISLSKGYYTMLAGKGGNQLTKVQKVRLAIARALFKDPKILLVDNITGGLNYRESKSVLTTLRKVCKNRTCIIATSRIAEISHANVILMLSHGRVIEKGNHAQLLALRGCYAVLLQKQEQVWRRLRILPSYSPRRDRRSPVDKPIIRKLKYVTGQFTRERMNTMFKRGTQTLLSVNRLAVPRV